MSNTETYNKLLQACLDGVEEEPTGLLAGKPAKRRKRSGLYLHPNILNKAAGDGNRQFEFYVKYNRLVECEGEIEYMRMQEEIDNE